VLGVFGFGFCSDVHLTDGNPNSVYNVERILERNVFTTKVTCSVSYDEHYLLLLK
jgi:hypothetical protein